MVVNERLLELLNQADADPALKKRLLDSRNAKDPYLTFCNIAKEAGVSISVGELFSMGQEYCDNLLKSVNGGATYPMEGWDDAYEMFCAALEGQK